jgi:hypothetical protein
MLVSLMWRRRVSRSTMAVQRRGSVTVFVTSTDPAVAALLDRTRLYFVGTMNPDGRVAGTRANANGFDMNRDFITQSQPETAAVRQALIDAQPLVMLDIHGYVNGTRIEPCTPPHGQNYEYDLFIEHAYANGLGMEAAGVTTMHGVPGFFRFAHVDGLITADPAVYARLPRVQRDESRTQGLDQLEPTVTRADPRSRRRR